MIMSDALVRLVIVLPSMLSMMKLFPDNLVPPIDFNCVCCIQSRRLSLGIPCENVESNRAINPMKTIGYLLC